MRVVIFLRQAGAIADTATLVGGCIVFSKNGREGILQREESIGHEQIHSSWFLRPQVSIFF